MAKNRTQAEENVLQSMLTAVVILLIAMCIALFPARSVRASQTLDTDALFRLLEEADTRGENDPDPKPGPYALSGEFLADSPDIGAITDEEVMAAFEKVDSRIRAVSPSGMNEKGEKAGESGELADEQGIRTGDPGETMDEQGAGSADWGKEDPDPSSSVEPDPSAYITPASDIADFDVTKTALTASARPGDTVVYEIRIENTGNVDLHSVISTEKFLGAGINAVFIPAEGLLLNANRTQALIEKIEPGETAVLRAQVVIPSGTQGQELVNQVTVTTAETGERTRTSEAAVRVAESSPSGSTGGGGSSGSSAGTGQSQASVRSASPSQAAPTRTQDPMQPAFYFSMILFAFFALVIALRLRIQDRR